MATRGTRAVLKSKTARAQFPLDISRVKMVSSSLKWALLLVVVLFASLGPVLGQTSGEVAALNEILEAFPSLGKLSPSLLYRYDNGLGPSWTGSPTCDCFAYDGWCSYGVLCDSVQEIAQLVMYVSIHFLTQRFPLS